MNELRIFDAPTGSASSTGTPDEELAGLGYSIVRPTVVFGREDILINNITYIPRRLPVFGKAPSGLLDGPWARRN